jgi:outer membrane murein-binding lipoprotein Lpp
MITRAEGAYLGALRAFQEPMLDLLHRRYAPLVVSLLSLVFTPERPTVPVAEAHTEIGDALDQLRAQGYELNADGTRAIPLGSARELCRQWADVGWLKRQIVDGDVEVYQLSAHAVGALEVAGRAGGARARISESRVRTLMEAVEQLAQDANPDVMMRMARLDKQIVRLQEEHDRIFRTQRVDEVDDEVLLEEVENVLHLVRELPADFARVAESIRAMQRDVVTALRQDERPSGDVLREYLERGEQVMTATPEGRAFAGALRLIGDPERIDELSLQLDTVLRHSFSSRLPAQQRTELRDIGRRIEQGVAEVIKAQRQASHVITTQVRNHDPLRDRQVDELLREVMVGFQAWVPTSRRGQVVDPVRRLPVAVVAQLRQSTSDLRPPQPPVRLQVWDDDPDTDPDHSAREWGGPHYAELAEHVASFPADDGTADLALVFNSAPEGIRRPVDLLGLLEIAHYSGMTETEQVTFVDAVRPDGTRRRFAFGGTEFRTKGDTDD